MAYKSRMTFERMVELYHMGFSPEEIAKENGYKNAEYITSKLRTAGILRAKSIDKGKVLALHKAGWNTAKIAQEMVTSVESIEELLNGF